MMKVAPNCKITTNQIIILIKYMELVGSTKAVHVVKGMIIFEYFICTHIKIAKEIETVNILVSHFTANCLLLYLTFRGKIIIRYLWTDRNERLSGESRLKFSANEKERKHIKLDLHSISSTGKIIIKILISHQKNYYAQSI